MGYPERLCRCVIYMAPKIFFVLWKAVRRFMDERLTSKARGGAGSRPTPRDCDQPMHPRRLAKVAATDLLSGRVS